MVLEGKIVSLVLQWSLSEVLLGMKEYHLQQLLKTTHRIPWNLTANKHDKAPTIDVICESTLRGHVEEIAQAKDM